MAVNLKFETTTEDSVISNLHSGYYRSLYNGRNSLDLGVGVKYDR